MLICVPLALCFLLSAIFDRTSVDLIQRIIIFMIRLFIASPVFVGIYQLFNLRSISLSLHKNGLIFRRHGKETTTTWDEIDSYIEESACRITRKDDEVIEFGLGIEGAEEVAEEIRKQTLKRMLPQMKAAILSGSSVQFKGIKPFKNELLGKGLNNFSYAFSGFAVDADGITAIDGGEHIPWKDITDYGIVGEQMGKILVDVFFVQSANASFRTRLGLLSNAHILLALCAEMTGPNRDDRRDQSSEAEV
jgi:hypothetical protein